MSGDKYLEAWEEAWRAIRQKEIAGQAGKTTGIADAKPVRRRIRRVIVEEVIEGPEDIQS